MRRLGIAFILMLLAGLPAHAWAQGASVGAVKALEGRAQVTRGGATAALHTGDPIYRDDILETEAGARVAVTFQDGMSLALGPNAEIVIDDYVYAPGGGANKAALRLVAGAARMVSGAMARADHETTKINTPVGTIGIRGTDLFAELQDRHLSAALFSGYEITVTNAAGTTTLRPGEGADVWGGAAPSHRQTWSSQRINRALALVTVGSPFPYARPLANGDSLNDALFNGHVKANVRYRFEHVDQADKAQDAHANTVRVRLGYETLAWQGFFAGIEGSFVRDFGDNHRSDGVTTRLQFPTIPDPDAERLEQGYIGWSAGTPATATRAMIGRQRLAYENERWIGPSDFRQTDQVFDAVAVNTRALPGFDLRYAYVSRVNRVLGNNINGVWSSNSHLIGASTTLVPFGVTTAYAYLLDLRPVPLLSSATEGVRYDGAIDAGNVRVGLEAEIAHQSDYGRNPNTFGLTYALVRPSVKWMATTLFAGWESLGSNGRVAVQTPLATFHAQNGWADMFGTTPVNGLRDVKLRMLQELPDAGPFRNIKLDLRWHDFAASHGSAHYGDEWDADVNASVNGWLTLGTQFAQYHANGFGTNTTKVWVYVEVVY